MFKNRKLSLIWWPFLLNTKIIKNVCVKRNILCAILLQPKEQFVILRSVPKLSFGTFLLEYYNNTNESRLFPQINSKVVCEPVSYEYFTKAFKQKTYTWHLFLKQSWIDYLSTVRLRNSDGQGFILQTQTSSIKSSQNTTKWQKQNLFGWTQLIFTALIDQEKIN